MQSSTPPPFDFPREYSFPPFFTRQTNLTTHHAQLTKWAALVLAYCAHYRIFRLSLSGVPVTSSSSSTTAPGGDLQNQSQNHQSHQPDELFHNRRINRRLSVADAREVVDFLRRDGRAEYVSSSLSGRGEDRDGDWEGGGGDVVWVYWRTPEEWAEMVERWVVEETAQRGTVLTLYELTQGESTRGTEFHGLDSDLLQKALNVLVRRGKAQIFGQEDSLGVKFF